VEEDEMREGDSPVQLYVSKTSMMKPWETDTRQKKTNAKCTAFAIGREAIATEIRLPARCGRGFAAFCAYGVGFVSTILSNHAEKKKKKEKEGKRERDNRSYISTKLTVWYTWQKSGSCVNNATVN
jgi:hypothetical protein